MVGSPGVHPGYPGSIPEQGAKISLQDHSLLSLQDHEHVFQLLWLETALFDPILW